MLVQTLGALCRRPRVGLPRQMTDGVVTLRGYRYTDLPQLYPLVQPEIVWHSNGIVQHATPSFMAFCLWMLTMFPLAYIIAVVAHGRRVVGFVGRYKLKRGQAEGLSSPALYPVTLAYCRPTFPCMAGTQRCRRDTLRRQECQWL